MTLTILVLFKYLSTSMPKITNCHSHQTARRSVLVFSMVCQPIRQSMDSRRQTCQPRHRVTALMDDSMPMPNPMRKFPKKKIVGSCHPRGLGFFDAMGLLITFSHTFYLGSAYSRQRVLNFFKISRSVISLK